MNCNCALQISIKEATFLKDSDLIGKQDPYIQFTYDEEEFKTDIQDDAGLHAKFTDVFVLENIQNQIKEDVAAQLVMKAFDKDVASSDLLGTALATSMINFVQDDKEHEHDFDIWHEFKRTGNMKFTTKFIWRAPDPPPNPKLNSNCRLEIKILEAHFLKDADLIGKQDPYMRFKYDGITAETDVMDGAGLHAIFKNEKFCLFNVEKQILAGKRFGLEAYDKDLATSDFLGQIRPIAYVYLTEHEEPMNQVLDLFDKQKKKAGTV